jgi:hypothetical protein
VAGCAAVSGLDHIHEAPCAPYCDDGGEGSIEEGDATNDLQVVPATLDSMPEHGASSEASYESAFDSGCGALNSVENCSACGDKCAPTSPRVTSASCSGAPDGQGAACVYTCATGYLDCNHGTTPADLDGCECQVPLGAASVDCCGGGCPVQHDNGVGQIFFECSTNAKTIATDACASFTSDPAQCDLFDCDGDDGGTAAEMVCSDGSPTECVCWAFTGANAGRVDNAGVPAGANYQNCSCPDSTDPTYD